MEGGFLPTVGMTGQCFIEEGERGAGGKAARPSFPIIPHRPVIPKESRKPVCRQAGEAHRDE